LADFATFLSDFGSRGPNEWDLGSDPWALRPELALAAIDRMRSADPEHAPHRQAARLAEGRRAAVAAVRSACNPIDRYRFDKVLAATTLFSQARERTKTTVIAGIHSARLAQVELARRIEARGGPAQRWKTCLLGADELEACLRDPAPFLGEIEARAHLHARLSSLVPPFVIDGTVPDLSTWQRRDAARSTVEAGRVLTGIAGCPGVVRGRARVVLDPGDPGDLGPGDVLVAPITDPSWTPLFLAAEAVVVDVGATMSHAVIVSCELGIPCVVSVAGATTTIPPGALLEVDGSAGTVTVVELAKE
jgi:pyruvate,water dikinase